MRQGAAARLEPADEHVGPASLAPAAADHAADTGRPRGEVTWRMMNMDRRRRAGSIPRFGRVWIEEVSLMNEAQ